jgi:Cys-tRNA(Pro) deacylase
VSKDKAPVTPAVRQLRAAGVSFTDHLYEYEDKGGTGVSARELQLDEHSVVKTLVMQDQDRNPLIVLMHGDRQVSTKELARTLGVKTIQPCGAETANRHTGYQVGGTSPLGLRKPLPVYVEASVLELPRIYINGGKRGYLVGMAPGDLVKVLRPTPVHVATDKD